MQFCQLAEVFDRLESTSSRLEMTDILARSFAGMDPSDLRNTIYLSQGLLHPDFYPEKLGMADRLILQSIASTSGNPVDKVEQMWIREGDLLIISVWDFEPSKCDVRFRYTKTQAMNLSKKNKIPKNLDIF